MAIIITLWQKLSCHDKYSHPVADILTLMAIFSWIWQNSQAVWQDSHLEWHFT